jgi:2,3-dihydroxybenzoate decarboxylase/5-carboxyvanillate decarboxylase
MGLKMERRSFLAGSGVGLALLSGGRALASQSPLKRIAVEEAWSFAEHLDALRATAEAGGDNLDLEQLRPLGINSASGLGARLTDLDRRLAEMDRLNIDMQLLSLTSPGVQVFARDQAVGLAQLANDRLAEAVARHPARFAGLASFAPQNPPAAAKEMERAVTRLGLNGFVVNSHTFGHYLDEPQFTPILEAAEALDRPIYIHPRSPSDGMAAPFRDHRLRAAIWGYAMETGTHAMRMMVSGVFDRFPKLQIVLGHMGENIPFHLWRSDHWFERRRSEYASSLKPSEIFARNFSVTTSGVEHGPALRYTLEVLGPERIMWAIDYPYEEMQPSVHFMDKLEIAPSTRRAIYGGNAARQFRLRSPAS